MFAQMADKLPYMTKIGHGWRWRLRYRIIVARLENQVLAGEPRR